MFHFEDLEIETHSSVYDPAEDTFLLIESLDIKKNDNVFEIGTGTGIIALYCLKKGANVLCSDINPYSIDLVKRNYYNNKDLFKGSFEIRQGDLFSVLKKSEKFDVIIFNPPYLPTEKQDLVDNNGWFDISVDGGLDGLRKIELFLDGLDKHLKNNGRGYFIYSSLSDEKKLRNLISKNNFSYNIVKSRNFNDERLDVYCIKNRRKYKG